ncbi:hypothetical protein CSUI_000984, partial [Cystoisospora suis]
RAALGASSRRSQRYQASLRGDSAASPEPVSEKAIGQQVLRSSLRAPTSPSNRVSIPSGEGNTEAGRLQRRFGHDETVRCFTGEVICREQEDDLAESGWSGGKVEMSRDRGTTTVSNTGETESPSSREKAVDSRARMYLTRCDEEATQASGSRADHKTPRNQNFSGGECARQAAGRIVTDRGDGAPGLGDAARQSESYELAGPTEGQSRRMISNRERRDGPMHHGHTSRGPECCREADASAYEEDPTPDKSSSETRANKPGCMLSPMEPSSLTDTISSQAQGRLEEIGWENGDGVKVGSLLEEKEEQQREEERKESPAGDVKTEFRRGETRSGRRSGGLHSDDSTDSDSPPASILQGNPAADSVTKDVALTPGFAGSLAGLRTDVTTTKAERQETKSAETPRDDAPCLTPRGAIPLVRGRSNDNPWSPKIDNRGRGVQQRSEPTAEQQESSAHSLPEREPMSYQKREEGEEAPPVLPPTRRTSFVDGSSEISHHEVEDEQREASRDSSTAVFETPRDVEVWRLVLQQQQQQQRLLMMLHQQQMALQEQLAWWQKQQATTKLPVSCCASSSSSPLLCASLPPSSQAHQPHGRFAFDDAGSCPERPESLASPASVINTLTSLPGPVHIAPSMRAAPPLSPGLHGSASTHRRDPSGRSPSSPMSHDSPSATFNDSQQPPSLGCAKSFSAPAASSDITDTPVVVERTPERKESTRNPDQESRQDTRALPSMTPDSRGEFPVSSPRQKLPPNVSSEEAAAAHRPWHYGEDQAAPHFPETRHVGASIRQRQGVDSQSGERTRVSHYDSLNGNPSARGETGERGRLLSVTPGSQPEQGQGGRKTDGARWTEEVTAALQRQQIELHKQLHALQELVELQQVAYGAGREGTSALPSSGEGTFPELLSPYQRAYAFEPRDTSEPMVAGAAVSRLDEKRDSRATVFRSDGQSGRVPQSDSQVAGSAVKDWSTSGDCVLGAKAASGLCHADECVYFSKSLCWKSEPPGSEEFFEAATLSCFPSTTSMEGEKETNGSCQYVLRSRAFLEDGRDGRKADDDTIDSGRVMPKSLQQTGYQTGPGGAHAGPPPVRLVASALSSSSRSSHSLAFSPRTPNGGFASSSSCRDEPQHQDCGAGADKACASKLAANMRSLPSLRPPSPSIRSGCRTRAGKTVSSASSESLLHHPPQLAQGSNPEQERKLPSEESSRTTLSAHNSDSAAQAGDFPGRQDKFVTQQVSRGGAQLIRQSALQRAKRPQPEGQFCREHAAMTSEVSVENSAFSTQQPDHSESGAAHGRVQNETEGHTSFLATFSTCTGGAVDETQAFRRVHNLSLQPSRLQSDPPSAACFLGVDVHGRVPEDEKGEGESLPVNQDEQIVPSVLKRLQLQQRSLHRYPFLTSSFPFSRSDLPPFDTQECCWWERKSFRKAARILSRLHSSTEDNRVPCISRHHSGGKRRVKEGRDSPEGKERDPGRDDAAVSSIPRLGENDEGTSRRDSGLCSRSSECGTEYTSWDSAECRDVSPGNRPFLKAKQDGGSVGSSSSSTIPPSCGFSSCGSTPTPPAGGETFAAGPKLRGRDFLRRRPERKVVQKEIAARGRPDFSHVESRVKACCWGPVTVRGSLGAGGQTQGRERFSRSEQQDSPADGGGRIRCGRPSRLSRFAGTGCLKGKVQASTLAAVRPLSARCTPKEDEPKSRSSLRQRVPPRSRQFAPRSATTSCRYSRPSRKSLGSAPLSRSQASASSVTFSSFYAGGPVDLTSSQDELPSFRVSRSSTSISQKRPALAESSSEENESNAMLDGQSYSLNDEPSSSRNSRVRFDNLTGFSDEEEEEGLAGSEEDSLAYPHAQPNNRELTTIESTWPSSPCRVRQSDSPKDAYYKSKTERNISGAPDWPVDEQAMAKMTNQERRAKEHGNHPEKNLCGATRNESFREASAVLMGHAPAQKVSTDQDPLESGTSGVMTHSRKNEMSKKQMLALHVEPVADPSDTMATHLPHNSRSRGVSFAPTPRSVSSEREESPSVSSPELQIGRSMTPTATREGDPSEETTEKREGEEEVSEREEEPGSPRLRRDRAEAGEPLTVGVSVDAHNERYEEDEEGRKAEGPREFGCETARLLLAFETRKRAIEHARLERRCVSRYTPGVPSISETSAFFQMTKARLESDTNDSFYINAICESMRRYEELTQVD